jgi:hypothetical protein
MYAEANMGHPSRTMDRVWEMKSAKLIWTRLKFSRPCGTEFGNRGSHAGSLALMKVGPMWHS